MQTVFSRRSPVVRAIRQTLIGDVKFAVLYNVLEVLCNFLGNRVFSAGVILCPGFMHFGLICILNLFLFAVVNIFSKPTFFEICCLCYFDFFF